MTDSSLHTETSTCQSLLVAPMSVGRLVAMSSAGTETIFWRQNDADEFHNPLQNLSIWWIHSELGTCHPNFGDHFYPAEAKPPQILPQQHMDCAYKTSISPGYQWWWNVRLHNALARGEPQPISWLQSGFPQYTNHSGKISFYKSACNVLTLNILSNNYISMYIPEHRGHSSSNCYVIL